MSIESTRINPNNRLTDAEHQAIGKQNPAAGAGFVFMISQQVSDTANPPDTQSPPPTRFVRLQAV